MNADLIDYLQNNSNVVSVNVIISRETTKNGSQYIHINAGDKVLYEFWHNPNKQDDNKPKSTGGKKPYLMLMVQEIEKLRSSGVKNTEELIGFIACLGQNVEWNTGKLIHKRSKKPLKYKELQNMFQCGKRKLDRVLGDLKSNGLLVNTQEGYFISSDLVKKGKMK